MIVGSAGRRLLNGGVTHRSDGEVRTEQDLKFTSRQAGIDWYEKHRGKSTHLNPRAKAPEGVDVAEKEGVRVVTVNLHAAVPTAHGPHEIDKQSLQALADVAAYVKGIDADVVMVQEVRQHGRTDSGVPFQVDALYYMLDADSVAFGGADKKNDGPWHKKAKTDHGNAVFTRNGYRIDRSANVDLVNNHGGTRYEDRAAVVASVVDPSGDQVLTAVSTHLSNGGENKELQERQLRQLDRLVADIRDDGEFTYRQGMSERTGQIGRGFASDAVVVGGDFNVSQSVADEQFGSRRDGLEHSYDQLDDATLQEELRDSPSVWLKATEDKPERYGNGYIDHLYSSGAVEAAHAGIDFIEYTHPDGRDSRWATDHAAVYADFRLDG